jgi:hypothetical protein
MTPSAECLSILSGQYYRALRDWSIVLLRRLPPKSRCVVLPCCRRAAAALPPRCRRAAASSEACHGGSATVSALGARCFARNFGCLHAVVLGGASRASRASRASLTKFQKPKNGKNKHTHSSDGDGDHRRCTRPRNTLAFVRCPVCPGCPELCTLDGCGE